MDQVLSEPFRLDCPLFADELVGRDGFEGLQPAPEVVVADEVAEVTSQLIVVVVVEAFHGGLLDRAVHPLDLAAIQENSPPDCFLILMAPGVLDLMLAADPVGDVPEGVYEPPRVCLRVIYPSFWQP